MKPLPKIIVLNVLLSFLFSPHLVYAKQQSNSFLSDAKKGEVAESVALTKIKLDGKRYYIPQVIEDFTKVAFNSTFWLENAGQTSLLYVGKYLDFRKENASDSGTKIDWLSEYVLRDEGVPHFGVINKWMAPIGISLDWPRYGDSSLSLAAKKGGVDRLHLLYPDLMTDLKDITAGISHSIGRTIDVVDPFDPKDETPEYARIRIVINQNTMMQNYFRLEAHPYKLSERKFELSLFSAVPFTPFSRSQVSGFYIPEANGSVGMAICYIRPDLIGREMTRHMLTECIVRSLGLPGLSRNRDAYVGLWNYQFDDISKTQALDDDSDALDIKSYLASFQKNLKSRTPHIKAITQYDQLMLGLLYCNAVKPGMDKNTAILAIVTNQECMEKILKYKEI